MTKSLQKQYESSHFFGGNAAFVEALYETWLKSPDQVPEHWRSVFEKVNSDGEDIAHGPIRDELARRARADPRADRRADPMGRSRSSRRWLREHFEDPYAQRAKAEGYRGRAAYKLIELDRKHGLLRRGMRVVDLGAAPGAWSQYAAARTGETGRVVATDVLPMEPIAGVERVAGDFHDPATLDAVLAALGESPADLVLSDMAPNMSGVDAVDQPAAVGLAELTHDLAVRVLKPGGTLLAKVFQGEGTDDLVAALRRDFQRVRMRKPAASRDRSREVYILAEGRKL